MIFAASVGIQTLIQFGRDMSESHGGDGGIYQRIPTWDGKATSWKSFEKDMQWFIAGEDLGKISYNLAVRLAQKQTGAVRRRAREFDPETLKPKPAVLWTDATAERYNKDEENQECHVKSGAVRTGADHPSGIALLMTAWRTMVGMDTAETKGELRDVFYKTLMRRPGERVVEWNSRFREHTSCHEGGGHRD